MRLLNRLFGRRQPVVLLLLDLVQDLDLILPVAAGLQQQSALAFKVVATGRVLEKSPRIQAAFDQMGIAVDAVSHKGVLKGRVPSLQGVSAVITAVETTAGPHRVAHALVNRANDAGIVTYTLQHGFENIGLTYSDEVYSYEATRFASQHILIWGDPANLPSAIAAETREKCIAVGCPKFAHAPQALPPLHHGGTHLMAIFENLHWERYSDSYRQQTLQDIEATAKAFPAVTFLIKPHPAGLWLSKQAQGSLPEANNIWVVDPRDPQWEPYTAPAFLAVADAAVSTPSTVILDAARLETPAAVVGYDLPLPAYEPLPCFRRTEDWMAFVEAICQGQKQGSAPLAATAIQRQTQAFLAQHILPGDAVARILDRVRLDIAQ